MTFTSYYCIELTTYCVCVCLLHFRIQLKEREKEIVDLESRLEKVSIRNLVN